MEMTRSQIFAIQLKMARAALGWSIKYFADFVGVSANTISNVENAHEALTGTIEAIERHLKEIRWLELLPDDGESIGVRLHYKNIGAIIGDSPKLREFKKLKNKDKESEVRPPASETLDQGYVDTSIRYRPPEEIKREWAQAERDRNEERFNMAQYEKGLSLERDKRVGTRSRSTTPKNDPLTAKDAKKSEEEKS
jgi:transcriptional regulator with XRE-family HTH domain